MNKGLVFFSPTSGSRFLGTGLSFLRRDIVNFGRAFTTGIHEFVEFLLFFEKLLVSFLANCRHLFSFLLADLARGLILPFLYVNIRLGFSYFRLLLRAILTVTSIFVLPMLIVILSPFYRQLFNLLPLLLYFYYSTLASIMSIDFQDNFHRIITEFSTTKTGVVNGADDIAK